MDKIHRQKPDVKAFRDELSSKYDLVNIAFFADFSNPSLRAELFQIRQITNTIVETQNHSADHEKDFTDFIMLDHIYQSALSMDSKNIDTYIIFTGDGHFNSVVSFLVTKCKKEVGLYAVKDSVSLQISNSASYLRLYPDTPEGEATLETHILRGLRQLYDKNKNRRVHATFWATVDNVSKYNNLDREEVSEALRKLMDKGYIYQTKVKVSYGDLKLIKVNWTAVYRDKLL